jgi:hypothetical protein
MKIIKENWRSFVNEEQQQDPKVDKALKAITDSFTNAIKLNAKNIEATVAAGSKSTNVKQNKQPAEVEESALMAAAGATLAIPKILKLISTIVKNVGAALGAEMKNENFLDHLAHDIHHQYEGAIKLALKIIPSFRKLEEEKQKKVAEHVLNAIVAMLMLSSTAGSAAALAHGHTGHAAFEGALAAVKAGELDEYLAKAFA